MILRSSQATTSIRRKTVNSWPLQWQDLAADAAVMTAVDRITPGQALRAWRQHAGLTQQELVDALAVVDRSVGCAPEVSGKGTVANWEAGTRSPAFETVRKIAVALGLDAEEQDGLVGLWRAVGSVAALPPRPYWEHNYDAEGGRPAWLWLRCAPSGRSVTASVGWGPFGEDLEVPATAPGLLAHGPTSVPNPPLQVTFSEPAWADFGNGVVPQGVIERLGMHAVAGTVVARGRFVDPPELGPDEVKKVKADLDAMELATSKFKVVWGRVKPHLGAMRPNATVQPLEGARMVRTSWTASLRTDNRGELVTQILQPLQQIKAVRRAGRNMSVRAAAEAMNAPAAIGSEFYVTDDQIETLERNGRLPERARWFVARLDHAYDLDGHMGIDRVFVSRGARRDRQGRHEVAFPSFWVGPIWLQLHAPESEDRPSTEGTLDLYWGYWRRLQRVRHETIVTTRKAVPRSDPKLLVGIPPGWTFVAGTGLPPGAIDINHDWYPATFGAAAKLVFEGFTMLRREGHV
jgi:transcriptional regulator with XRE-family HTH domain